MRYKFFNKLHLDESGNFDLKKVKETYKELLFKYHPDKNTFHDLMNFHALDIIKREYDMIINSKIPEEKYNYEIIVMKEFDCFNCPKCNFFIEIYFKNVDLIQECPNCSLLFRIILEGSIQINSDNLF